MVQTYSNTDRKIFQDEINEDFERTKPSLPMIFDPGGIKAGKTYQWDRAGLSGSAKRRGRDGNIPRGAQPFDAVTADIDEQFSEKLVINDIDAFTGNPNIRSTLGKKTIAQCNRAIDQKCVDILDATSTQFNSGTAVVLNTLKTVLKLRDTILANDVPGDDGNIWVLGTIAMGSALQQIPEFKSRDYVELYPAQDGGLAARKYVKWEGVNWMTFNGLTNKGLATAKCYIFHKTGPGFVYDGEPEPHVYYYEPEDRWEHYSKIRTAGVAVLTRGILQFVHDDTAAYT